MKFLPKLPLAIFCLFVEVVLGDKSIDVCFDLGSIISLHTYLQNCKFYLWQLVLFGEIVLAQKVMYEKFGNDFLVPFVSKGFPAAHCPQDLAEKYCQQLQVLWL